MKDSALVRWGLVIGTGLVALITFSISFHGLDGFGYHLMRLGRWSALVPLGVDLSALVALISAHMRRGDRWTRRAYAWLVFGVTGALSVAGNLADGVARGLPTAGLAGVAAAPVVFVLVSHLAITSWRGEPGAPADEPTPPPATEQPVPMSDVVTGNRTPRSDSAQSKVAKVRRRHPQASQDEVARKAGVTVQTVKRHWLTTAPDVKPSSNGHHADKPVPADEFVPETVEVLS